jgi:hypothetical protein
LRVKIYSGPDDDYFWKVAQAQGFEVKRGYLGTNNRSKQDDAYLISEIVSTIYEKPGPSTIVLVVPAPETLKHYVHYSSNIGCFDRPGPPVGTASCFQKEAPEVQSIPFSIGIVGDPPKQILIVHKHMHAWIS